MKLPDDVFFPTIITQGYTAFGVDEAKNLWFWGNRFSPDNSENDWVEKFESSSKPVKCSWFSDKKLKIQQVKAGYGTAIVKASDENANAAFYAISNHEGTSDRFGESKEEFGRIIVKMEGFNPNSVIDFACGIRSTMLLMKSPEKTNSVIPGNPDA